MPDSNRHLNTLGGGCPHLAMAELELKQLPVELIKTICIQAAYSDWKCGYALALTSQDVCRWTAKARWSTVVLTSYSQRVSFWKAICAIPEDTAQGFFELVAGPDNERISRFKQLVDQYMELPPVSKRMCEGLSFPSSQPHRFVENLFVEDEEESRVESVYALDTIEYPLPSSLLTRWFQDETSQLNVVSLGKQQAASLNYIPTWKEGALSHAFILKELTMVVDGNESWPSHTIVPFSVQRLHIIGVSADAELSGVEPPWSLFRMLQQPILTSTQPQRRMLTHLRYDTRRFAFKPAEITAKRLRPLLQELTAAPTAQMIELDLSQASAKYRHTGPRHAAPARGAGNLLHLKRIPGLVPVSQLINDPVAKKLHEIGVGQLHFVQLAWKPMPNSAGESADKVAKPSTEETGGWPRERRGAWTERTEKHSQDSAFAAELQEAIDLNWGWAAPGVQSAYEHCKGFHYGAPKEQNSAFSHGGMLSESAQLGQIGENAATLDAVHNFLSKCVPKWRQDQIDGGPLARYGIRAPLSLLHLGGLAALTMQNRLRVFENRVCGGQGPWP